MQAAAQIRPCCPFQQARMTTVSDPVLDGNDLLTDEANELVYTASTVTHGACKTNESNCTYNKHV
jgi:hypothetical protein